MKEKINAIKAALADLTATTPAEVEELRIKYLSKKGEISMLFNDFRTVPAESKKEVGQLLNALKVEAQAKIAELKACLASADDPAYSDIDLTRTPSPLPFGTRHPLSLVKREIIDIFARMGFTIAEGPEIEDDWHGRHRLRRCPAPRRYPHKCGQPGVPMRCSARAFPWER